MPRYLIRRQDYPGADIENVAILELSHYQNKEILPELDSFWREIEYRLPDLYDGAKDVWAEELTWHTLTELVPQILMES